MSLDDDVMKPLYAAHYTPLARIVHPVVAIRRQFPRGRARESERAREGERERGFGGQFYSYLPLYSLFRNTIFS